MLQGLGEFTQHDSAGTVVTFLIRNGALIMLWWASVRRRRYSIWGTACQMVAVLGLAQLVSLALVAPRVVPADVHLQWFDVAKTTFFAQFALSPLRFVEAALLVTVGRFLPGSGRGNTSRSATASA